MISMRQLKEAMKNTVIIVVKVNGIDVIPADYNLSGVALDVHKVEKITVVAAGVVEVEIVGGTGVETQGFKRA
jgi:hypothetical protein